MTNPKLIITIALSILLFGCSKSKNDSSNQGRTNADASGYELFQQNGAFGFKDLVGQIAVKPQFAEAGEFSEGLARVKPDAQGPWGYIDGTGGFVMTPRFDGASDFHKGRALVQSNGKFAYIGPDGKILGFFEDAPSYRPLSPGDTLYVVHPNGLIAHAGPSVGSESVGPVQFGEPVQYVYDPHPRQYETIDGLRGSWLPVRYRDRQGYLFDVYLARWPQTEQRRVVEKYTVVVSGANNETYSTYTLTKYLSGGRVNVHEGADWAESQEFVPASTVDQVLGGLKLFPSGQVGSVVALYSGDSGTFQTQQGDNVTITVQRDAGGFLEHVMFTRKSEEENFDISISRYNIHDVEIAIASTSNRSQDQSE